MPQMNTASLFTQSSADNSPSERRRQLARLLLARGLDDSPIQHPTQGAARMAHALIAGLEMRRADEQDRKIIELRNSDPMLGPAPAAAPKAETGGWNLAKLLSGLTSDTSAPSGFDPDNIGATPASFTPPAMSPVAPPPVMPPPQVIPPQMMPQAAPPQPEPLYNPLDPNVAEWREPNSETPVRDVQTRPVGQTAQAPQHQYSQLFAAKEQEYGLPPGYLTRTAQIESTMNPQAKNPNSSAGGLFQFIDSTAKQYGLNNRYDPVEATDAAARLARDNMAGLSNALGRPPSPAEMYLAHQQGLGGALKILSNPNTQVASLVGNDAARFNAGAGLSGQQFADRWLGKFNQGYKPPQGGGNPIPQQYAALNPLDPNPVDQRQMMQPASPMTPNIDYGPNAVPVGSTQGSNAPMAQAPQSPPNVQLAQAQIPGRPQQPGQQPLAPWARENLTIPPEVAARIRQFNALGATKEADALKALYTQPKTPKSNVLDGEVVLTDDSGRSHVAYRREAPIAVTDLAQRRAAGIPDDDKRPYQWSRAKGYEVITGQGTNVSIDQRAENTFKTEANKFMAERYGGMVKSADSARELAGDIQILRSTMANLDTNRLAEAKLSAAQWANSIGATDIANKLTDGKMSEYEAVAAIVDKLTPRMRVPGSGASSDRDMATFRNALPSLLRTPGGNNIVLATFEAMYDNQMRSGEIAERALRGEITQEEANRSLRELGTPFGAFTEYLKANKVEQKQPNNAAPTPQDAQHDNNQPRIRRYNPQTGRFE